MKILNFFSKSALAIMLLAGMISFASADRTPVTSGSSATSTFGFITATTTNATSTFAGDVYVTGNLRVTGNFFAPVAISSASDIRPSADVTYSLGTGALRWLNTYTQNLFATSSTVTGNATVGGTLDVGATTTLTNSGGSTNLVLAGATTGVGVNASGITGGTGFQAINLTNSGIGFASTITGNGGTGFKFNMTGVNHQTVQALYVTGTANITADYSGAYINLDATRNVSAAATRVFSGNFVNISPSYTISGSAASIFNVTGTTTMFTRTLSNAGTGGSASLSATAPVLSVANLKGAGTGTTTDSSTMVDFQQAFTGATGDVFRITNNGTGNLANFLGNGNIGIGTSTPITKLAVATGSIAVSENILATSTSMTIDWRQGNTQLVRISTSAVSIGFSNNIPGATLKLVICNAPTGTAGAVTFTGVTWSGGTVPTQTTTANKCDVWSFLTTMATGTQRILGSASTNF